jgi:hypothetical protein
MEVTVSEGQVSTRVLFDLEDGGSIDTMEQPKNRISINK